MRLILDILRWLILDIFLLEIRWRLCINDVEPSSNFGNELYRISATVDTPWWRHQMETFTALLALCVGNSQVTSEFTSQRSVTRNFDVFFVLHPNIRLSKQWWGWWFETPLECHPRIYNPTKTHFESSPSVAKHTQLYLHHRLELGLKHLIFACISFFH